MWAKVLGLVCAGVFIGAVVVEVKQVRRRRRSANKQVDSASPNEQRAKFDTEEADPVAAS